MTTPSDTRPVLFLSDLHLAPWRPDGLAAFDRFLAGPAREAGTVYILGDLFEYWIGADDPQIARPVLDRIGVATAAGVPVSFMPGNRDFLVDAAAARRTGMTLLPDPVVVTLFGRPVLLAHGDAYCTDDPAYQRYRHRVRSAWFRTLTGALPLSVRGAIARYARAKSDHTKREKPAAIMDVSAAAIASAFRAAGCDLMIHGHTHRPARHVHQVDGRECVRWVLADWYDHGSYLVLDGDGIRVVNFT